MYYHEHEVSMKCEALKVAATSLLTHDNLIYNPVLKKVKDTIDLSYDMRG